MRTRKGFAGGRFGSTASILCSADLKIDRMMGRSASTISRELALRRGFSCVAGPNRLKVTAAQLVLRRLSMQKWELTCEIVGSAIAIGALLVLLWHLGFVS